MVTAVLAAAVIFFVLATLPPTPIQVDLSTADPDLVRRTVGGAYHIHTTRSDGAGDKRTVAAAARRAGLQFAIFADHGDGTRQPDRPEYIEGVLCIDGVEISTNSGHYVAFDMPASPYPLGGEAAAVVEDVRRLGGFGVAAHPDSPKPELAWGDWRAPIDGLEWLSVDSEWRDETRGRIVRALADYVFRPAPAIASILDRPEATLTRWAALSEERPIVALASVDAHGGVRRRQDSAGAIDLGVSYEASFRTLSNRVMLDRPLSGDATADARLLMTAIRKGRVYTVIDALATPGLYDFGETPSRIPLPDGARVERVGNTLAPRFEIHLNAAPGTPPVPWLLTNAAYALWPAAPAAAALETPGPGVVLKADWRVEKSPTSTAEVARAAEGVMLSFSLGPPPRANQFVALVADLRQSPTFDEILFDSSSSRPMRVSVQLRFPNGDARWVKSVYVDQTQREVSVHTADMVAADRPGTAMPPPSTARAILFVIDLTNAVPGDAGSFTIANVRTALTTASAQSPAARQPDRSRAGRGGTPRAARGPRSVARP